jgi:hypothetical protein
LVPFLPGESFFADRGQALFAINHAFPQLDRYRLDESSSGHSLAVAEARHSQPDFRRLPTKGHFYRGNQRFNRGGIHSTELPES